MVKQYYVETKKDEGPTNGRIGIRPKKRLNEKRYMFDKWQIRIWTKKMDKNKNLSTLQNYDQKRWGLNEQDPDRLKWEQNKRQNRNWTKKKIEQKKIYV